MVIELSEVHLVWNQTRYYKLHDREEWVQFEQHKMQFPFYYINQPIELHGQDYMTSNIRIIWF
jgi:hypothetical protein